MKRILITGARSYVGSSVVSYLNRMPDQYQADGISVRGEDWKAASFQG